MDDVRVKRNSFMLAALALMLLNIEGFVQFTVAPSLLAGELNPVLAPLTLFAVFLIYFEFFLREIKTQGRVGVPVIIFVGIAATLVIAYFIKGDEATIKAARDIIYLWIIIFVYLIMSRASKQGLIDLKTIARVFVIFGVIALPLLAYVLVGKNPVSGRFAGWMLSEPIFANVIFLMMVLVLSVGVSRVLKVAGLLFAAFFIIESGTRTALLLLVGLVGYVIIFGFGGRRARIGRLAAIGAIYLLTVFLFPSAVGEPISDGSVRAVSVSDVQQGSINTRVVWYSQIYNKLDSTGFVGGFGPGASEKAIGAITHFDLLRYWYDYSIVYLGLFILICYWIFAHTLRRSDSDYLIRGAYLAFMFGSLVLLSMHNVLQSAGPCLLLAMTLFFAGASFQKSSSAGGQVEEASLAK